MNGFWQDAANRLRANPVAVAAFILLLVVALLSIVGPWLNPNSAEALDWTHVAASPGLDNSQIGRAHV